MIDSVKFFILFCSHEKEMAGNNNVFHVFFSGTECISSGAERRR